VHRHFLAPLAVCEEIKELSEEDVEKSLSPLELSKLRSFGEVRIDELSDELKKLLGIELGDSMYVKIARVE